MEKEKGKRYDEKGEKKYREDVTKLRRSMRCERITTRRVLGLSCTKETKITRGLSQDIR